MHYKRVLIWFRNNLRLKDNLPLLRAVTDAEEVVPIYVFREQDWDISPIGLPRTGTFRTQFLIDSVANLKDNLLKKGGDLHLSKGKPTEIIPEIIRKYEVDALYTTKEFGIYEQDDAKSIEQFCINNGVYYEAFSQHTLFHEDDIPWPINNLPNVFTQFRKENEKQTEIRALVEEPDSITTPKIEESDVLKLKDFGVEKAEFNPKAVLSFKGGEDAAWDRLNDYIWKSDQLRNYKFTRNGLLGADYSSKFSPWLANGCISPRSILNEVRKYETERHKNISTYWLYFELIWRDYFQFVLKKYGSKLFSLQGIKDEKESWSSDEELLHKWTNGQTGIPFIDANMRELNTTGFMSNRGRQLVASVLAKDLGLDWRMGAWYFEHQLIDHDVASNWGNWAYVAGVGNDPRANRYFNILSQAKKYDKKGDYVRYWLPELEGVEGYNVHKISLLERPELEEQFSSGTERYFNPVVDMKKWEF